MKIKNYLVAGFFPFMLLGNYGALLGMGQIDTPKGFEGLERADLSQRMRFTPEIEKTLDRLSRCESNNRDDIKILDSNKKYSYGRFMYQEETFKGFVKEYKLLPEAEDLEIMNFIYDGEFQRELTGMMLTKDRENWRHWYNCLKSTYENL